MFNLVMINVIAIDSLRTLPMTAQYGLSVVFFYILAAIVFFIPSALVSAELATGWPQNGGIYVWIREAFGRRFGFLVIWLQWFYNVCWYPTIMSLVAATLAYCIESSLANNKLYMISVIMVAFWGATLVNCFGMRASSLLSTGSAIIGTIIPMTFIAILGIVWVVAGYPVKTGLTSSHLLPDMSDLNHLVFLTALMYGLVGIEMSASHANDVEKPQKSYPKAVLISCVIILVTMVSASLAISIVVPKDQINIIAGAVQVFHAFFSAFGMTWMTPVMAILIVCGAIGCASAWMLGPSKGLLVASQDDALPSILSQVNKQGAPIAVLMLQGAVFTLLCLVFVFMPTVSSAFWVLTDVTAILAMVVYVAMFAAALRLRYKFPDIKRAFKVPGGRFGMWLVCGLGILSSSFTIFIGLLPPSQIEVGNIFMYELIITIGVLAGFLLPLGLFALNKLKRKDQTISDL